MSQISDITGYLAENPSVRLGIDGTTDPNVTGSRNEYLSERRVGAVRDALIQAGTPASKIETGTFGDPRRPRDGQVEVLLITAQ